LHAALFTRSNASIYRADRAPRHAENTVRTLFESVGIESVGIERRTRAALSNLGVIAEHSRLKNGVASLAYAPAIHLFKKMDARIKSAHDEPMI